MKALSIRQPWAWLIIHGGKDIENRGWRTSHRGPLLIHASKGMTVAEYEEVGGWLPAGCGYTGTVPAREVLERGGIIGQVDVVDCICPGIDEVVSPWYMEGWGWVLANPKPLPFKECKGTLGLFDVNYEELSHAAAHSVVS